MLILLSRIFSTAASKKVSDIVFCSPHRGRLNALVQLLDYPARDLFQKLSKKCELDANEGLSTFIDDIAMHIAVCNKKSFGVGIGLGEKETKNEMKVQTIIRIGPTEN